MADHHPLPALLEPEPHEHGLASGDLDALADRINRAWSLFADLVGEADLEAPSRKHGWLGRDVVAKVGEWEFGRRIDHMLADAHDGDADYYDADAIDEEVRRRAAELPLEEVLAAVERARATTARWLASDGPTTWGLVHTSSPLGPLPVLTVMNAMAYQLSIATLDLAPCGVQPPQDLMHIGLTALVDTTGALAGRAHVTGSFTAVTPELIVGVGTRGGHWRTAFLDEDPHHGPGVAAPAHVVLDVTSGRANVGHLYRTGELRVHDLAGMVRLAPVLDGIPGIPPLGAVGRALNLVDAAVGGLLGRFRR
jgi:hypothetical protein